MIEFQCSVCGHREHVKQMLRQCPKCGRCGWNMWHAYPVVESDAIVVPYLRRKNDA